MSVLEAFQDGEQVLLIDQRGKRPLLTLRKGETFHSDRGWIPHDAIIGHPDGSWVRSSLGMRDLALRPTLAGCGAAVGPGAAPRRAGPGPAGRHLGGAPAQTGITARSSG